ncbi:MAG: reprolysin-like metallopeptidase, partial [Chloroflexota bacterium]
MNPQTNHRFKPYAWVVLWIVCTSLPLFITQAPSSAAVTNTDRIPQPLINEEITPAIGTLADGGLWQDVGEAALRTQVNRLIIPDKYRTVAVDLDTLDTILAQAPLENSLSTETTEITLTIPLPDGGFGRFRLEESPIMDPGLAAKYPELKTYLGIGLDDPTATARFDRTPEGFHGMILSSINPTIFVDPYSRGDIVHYISYYKDDYTTPIGKTFVEEGPVVIDSEPGGIANQNMSVAASNGTVIRDYRLAMAATGEYTQFHGGTVAQALSAIVTTINRVNGIFIREVAVRMTLVSNTDNVIYTNGGTDPYTNSNVLAMLNQNSISLNSIIGSANYDIGHVFGTGGGGVASLRSVCTFAKARGVTGSSTPIGDPFDVDFVAHEIGHQFGANHTFNAGSAGFCSTRNATTAYEPGGGTTIMGYAGICLTQNVQTNSDDYFHGASFDEMVAFITNGLTGGSCGTTISVGNSVPTAEAGANYIIPRDTPFTLTGTGSDPNGDTLTYQWEEFDLGNTPADESILPNTDTDGNARPIFRSYSPTTDPSRTFPALASILSNDYQNNGEDLPNINRTMAFRFTARDQRGGVTNDSMSVTVDQNSGPFRVTSSGGATWTVGGNQTITWNVNNTDVAPVNCTNVNILLSDDGGQT